MTTNKSKALQYIKQHLHKIYESDDEPLYVTEEDAVRAVEIATRYRKDCTETS